jgi:hypothetical protein
VGNETKDGETGRDVVFVYSRAEGPGAYRVLRRRDDRLELGEVRAPREGEAVSGELVRLKRRKEHALLFDVEVMASREELGLPPAAPSRSARGEGPARVSSDAYRAGWDAVFGRGHKKPLPN